MAGTLAGGLKAKKTNISKHGADFYAKIGSKGGSTPTNKPKGFAIDNRTLWEKIMRKPKHAARAGGKGGKISKRGKK